jgi:hypothetical protein
MTHTSYHNPTDRKAYPEDPRRDWMVSPRGKSIPWLPLAGLLLALAVLIAPVTLLVGGYGYYRLTHRILPGVHVGSTDIGGLTVQAAAIELHKSWNLDKKILVSDGLHAWSLSPQELGISLDAVETARQAHNFSHDRGWMAGMARMIYIWRNDWQAEPLIGFDSKAARSGLSSLEGEATKPPQDASIAWDGSQLVEIPSQLGYAPNVEAALQAVASNPGAVLDNGYLELQLIPLPPRISDVSAALDEARRLVDSPLQINAYDPLTDEYFQWEAPPQEIGSWLKVEPGDQGPRIAIDREKAAAFLSQLDVTLGSERWLDLESYPGDLESELRDQAQIDLRVRHRSTVYTVQPGDTLLKIGWNLGIPYWRILNANPGLDPDNMWAGEYLTIPSKDELLPYPIIPNKRIVLSISKQRLWAYQNGELLHKYVISTGVDRSPTQPGVFQVQTHEIRAYASVWDLYMPHFIGIYEAWPGFMNGIHGLPTLSNGRRLWANILGRPASYGCIILDLDAAEWLYDWAEQGVVVEITP